jgi:hypothetical protein
MKTKLTPLLALVLCLLLPSPYRFTDRARYESHLQRVYHSYERHRGQGRMKPGHPELAGLREYIMTMDPATHEIPRETLMESYRYARSRARQQNLKSEAAGPYIWEEIPSDRGGRTRALMYDPNDPDCHKVWAGAVTGGLWYNDDLASGAGWQPVDDFWPSLSISCITYDPGNTDIFYVGTGEGQTAVIIYRESSGKGSGIWRSTDAGKTWELMESTSDFVYVTDIAVRQEAGGSVIYAAVVSGKYKGITHLSRPSDGLYRSADGGESWTQVLPDIPGTGDPYAPADIELGTDGRIYVGTMRNVDREGGGVILYSDDGIDWTVIDDYTPVIRSRPDYNIPGRVILAAAPSDPGRVYAVMGGGLPLYGFVYSRAVLILRSDDHGETWSTVSMPDENGGWAYLAWHALAAAVDPNDPDCVWIGGLDLYRSRDKGEGWTQVSVWWNFGPNYTEGYPAFVHADHHAIRFRPGSSDELLVSNDGGVFLTENAGQLQPDFLETNKGYNTLQYYTCVIHPQRNIRYFLAGTQDNGTLRTTAVTGWDSHVTGGDGTYCFIDTDQPYIQISGSQFNTLYFSSDGQHSEAEAFSYAGGIFVNPMDYDYSHNTIYANGQEFSGRLRDSLLKVTGIPWNPVGTYIYAGTGSQMPFSAVKVSPRPEGGNTRVFLGTQSGKLYRLDRAQDSPLASDIGSYAFPAGNISCIELGKTDDQILVTFSNYNVRSVWLSMDGGTGWEDKSGDLPDMPVRWAVFSPTSEHGVLLATELGVWYTGDITEDEVSWSQSLSGMPNVRNDMLRVRKVDDKVLAATHGRGLFLSSSAGGTGQEDASGEGISISPNPVHGAFWVVSNGSLSGPGTIELYDLSGRLVKTKEVLFTGQPDSFIFDPGPGMAPGTAVITCTAGGTSYREKIIIR